MPAFSASTPKAGSACSKKGVTKTYKGKEFKCLKKGGKLVWSKGKVVNKETSVAAPEVTPSVAPSPTPSVAPTASSSGPDQENLLEKSCANEGTERTTFFIFICVRTSDLGLIWIRKGTESQYRINASTPTSTPSALPTPTATQENVDTYSEPSELSDKIDLCKIKEVNLNGPRNGRAGPEGAPIYLPSGFPRVTPSTQHIGTVKWALIPIDFSDLKGESNFRSRVDSQMELLTDWYFTVSEGNLKVDWSVHNDWVTLPKPSSQYTIGNSVNLMNSEVGQALFRDAMTSADPVFDFTNIQYVIFLLPKGQTFLNETSQGFPWDKLVIDITTSEGKVSGFAIPGVFMDQPNKDYWGYWAHEFGHAISLAHIGRSRGTAPLFAGYDLMANQDGPTRDLNGWLRFVAQWLQDEKVYCKESKAINRLEVTLVPLNSFEQGIKLVVIPLSITKALMIESRRETKFSCQMKPTQNGILAYIYDSTLSHGEDFLIPIAPDGRSIVSSPCPASPMIDSLLRTGDKISVDGFIIENLLSGNFDKIRITKQP